MSGWVEADAKPMGSRGEVKHPAKASSGDEKKISSWIKDERCELKANRLAHGERKKLHALPNWRWSKLDPAWREMFEKVQS